MVIAQESSRQVFTAETSLSLAEEDAAIAAAERMAAAGARLQKYRDVKRQWCNDVDLRNLDSFLEKDLTARQKLFGHFTRSSTFD
jgi:hypothetical protein